MATAKRVKQEDRVETLRTPSTTQRFVVTETDGVEVRRIPSSPVTTTRISEKRTPQPDRIVLEMSVEEAKVLMYGLCFSGDTRVTGLIDTLQSVVYPKADTQTSPAKDAAGGGALGGYNPSWRDPR